MSSTDDNAVHAVHQQRLVALITTRVDDIDGVANLEHDQHRSIERFQPHLARKPGLRQAFRSESARRVALDDGSTATTITEHSLGDDRRSAA